MLSDRPYMRPDYQRETTSVLTWILCALVAGFIVQNVFGVWLGSNSIEALFGLTFQGLRHGYVWSLLTHTLLHQSVFHLLFNGLAIFFLGRELLPLLGARRFLGVVGAASITGAALWLTVHYLNGHPSQLMGTGACVMALFIVFACIYAERDITFLLFYFIPITTKPKYLAWILVGLDLVGFLFSEIPGGRFDTGIAYSAHVGGILVGWIYYRFLHAAHGLDGSPTLSMPAWLRRSPKVKSPKPASTAGRLPDLPLRAEVDRILDKINSEGFGALTEAEKRVLDEAKDLLSRR